MVHIPVNIGDFRCRGRRSRVANSARGSDDRPRGMMLAPVEARPERESLRDALVAENPPVFDIAIAREATRMSQRMIVRPVPVQRRRAQIIQISEPRVAVMTIEEGRRRDGRRAGTDDYDL